MHAWLAKYAAGGLEGLADGSQRPRSCPHQMPGDFEALVAEMRRRHVGWGPRRIACEPARQAVDPAPSESAVYRCLVPLGLVEPDTRRRRRREWKRWERAARCPLLDPTNAVKAVAKLARTIVHVSGSINAPEVGVLVNYALNRAVPPRRPFARQCRPTGRCTPKLRLRTCRQVRPGCPTSA